MRQQGIRPVTAIAAAALAITTSWFGYSLVTQPALAGERYAAKPVGWDSPAGKCVVCHSLEKNGSARVAPTLWGIVGAPKGAAKGYGYSLALAKAGGKWTEKELNEYLTSPSRFLPGTTKTIVGLPNDKERAKVIAYLATLKD